MNQLPEYMSLVEEIRIKDILYFLEYRKCSFEGVDLMKDGKLGCGGLIAIILLVFAFLNDFASELGGAFQFFFWIGIIIIIVAVVKFFHDN